jgi:beta-galactosidase
MPPAAFRDLAGAALPEHRRRSTGPGATSSGRWNTTIFDQIDLPNLTVTEPNPAHGWTSAASPRTRSCLQPHPDRDPARPTSAPLIHNYMGRITISTISPSAPISTSPAGTATRSASCRTGSRRARHFKAAFLRQGDPDNPGLPPRPLPRVGRGRWWVMEQQPGPVNWAPYNPAPLPGMVRLWTWEAFAHGAEAVCYFRWRRPPSRRRQMHAGLLRPDSRDAPGLTRRQVARELGNRPEIAAFAPGRSASSSTTPRPGPGRPSRRAATSTTSACLR